VHGCVPEIMSLSTVIPIPKGKHANLTKSVSYRGIALSPIFGKILDLVLLFRYSEGLMSCDLQFGFKARRAFIVYVRPIVEYCSVCLVAMSQTGH